MDNPLQQLAQTVHSRLVAFGQRIPTKAVIGELITVAYFASLKTEESRFVRGSITFARPARPDEDPPRRRRADYPAFHRLTNRIPLNVESLVKLARAVDAWCGSIAVYGKHQSALQIWGIADQIVQRNTRLAHEARGGFSHPGILTIAIEGVGKLSVYHGDYFLAGIQAQTVLRKELDAFISKGVHTRIAPFLVETSQLIVRSLPDAIEASRVDSILHSSWISIVSRICIGLRRIGTGGALIITPRPRLDVLDVGHEFQFRRLSQALALKVLDDGYEFQLHERIRNAGTVAFSDFWNHSRAQADAEDREEEINGAVKLVTSLAALDGALLLDPALSVIGFGTKIGDCPLPRRVYHAQAFEKHGSAASTVNLAQFGTRHTSVLRYCRLDRSAIGVIISQDGYVRVALSIGRSVVLWDQVKLLDHDDFNRAAVRREKMRLIAKRRIRGPTVLGYSPMPKTLDQLALASRK